MRKLKHPKGESKDYPASVSTALADEYRLPIYPVSRIKSEAIETKFGTVRFVRGGVTAHHRDVLDVITAFAEEIDFSESGEIDIIFDPDKIAKVLEIDTEWRFQRELLRDLVGTVIEVRRAGAVKWEGAFSVLTFVGDTDIAAKRAAGQFGTCLKKITLSKHYAALMQTDVALQLGPELVMQVVRLRHQVSRSGAKWLLTHSNDQHHKINDLLSYVGCKGSRMMMSKYRKQLMEDSEGLGKIGIRIEDKVIHYARNKGVFITVGKNVNRSSEDVNQTSENVNLTSEFIDRIHNNLGIDLEEDFDEYPNVNQSSEQPSSQTGINTSSYMCVNLSSESVLVEGHNVNRASEDVNPASESINLISENVNPISEDSKGIILKELDLKGINTKETRWSIHEFRVRYEEYFGISLAGGLNNKAGELCRKYSIAALEYALEQAALSNVSNLRYIESVLENYSKSRMGRKKSAGSSDHGQCKLDYGW